MMKLDGVVVNAQVAELALQYLTSENETLLSELVSCPAAKKTHAHACRFGNTDDSIFGFWKSILHDASKDQPGCERRIQSNLAYLKSHKSTLLSAIREIEEYLPANYEFQTRLNLILGYDIGIVSQGEAMLNITHSHFSNDRRELIYLIMHELHHVAYTDYHPIYSLDDLQTTDDFMRIIRYSTQLEGFGVYTSLNRRIEENGLGHEDYQFLLNPKECTSRVEEYFDIIEVLNNEKKRELKDSDFEIMEKMSGRGSRLWYVTGAYMCKVIDEKLGRRTLTETIIDGPDSFFEAYGTARNRR
ncbi:MAG: hypothetical protein KGY80_03980 [Candidatus Thorarchaeota archaeon]|nr:hypothetical protein [Candidatus Thorarchaeota archaeon]